MMNPTLQKQAESNQSLFRRAQEMASGKTESQMEEIARNICATKGIDFNSALEQFRQMWGK